MAFYVNNSRREVKFKLRNKVIYAAAPAVAMDPRGGGALASVYAS